MSIKAMKRAIEVLEELQGGCTDSNDGTVEALTVWTPEVIEELRNGITEAENAKPLFYYRPTCNGDMYEGPIHANSVGGAMLRAEKPGEWLPLYGIPAQTAQAKG